MAATKDGYIDFRGHRTWYRTVGEGEEEGRSPLLILHGGPGSPHDYLEPLEALTSTGRRVIFYDQLGCGNSDQPHDPSMWTVSLFLDELARVREALGLSEVHILGHSWGGMLAMEHALTRPEGLRSLVLSDTLASVPLWISEANRLRSLLPDEVQATLLRHERAGTTDSPEYQEAMLVFYRRHVCRIDPWPECLVRTFDKLAKNPEVYNTMFGPSEFYAPGRLKDWDLSARLVEIATPALLLSGRYDEATPTVVGQIHAGLPRSSWALFEEGSHMPHLEQPKEYLEEVSRFLDRVETGPRRGNEDY